MDQPLMEARVMIILQEIRVILMGILMPVPITDNQDPEVQEVLVMVSMAEENLLIQKLSRNVMRQVELLLK